jgi:hypothetical protein
MIRREGAYFLGLGDEFMKIMRKGIGTEITYLRRIIIDRKDCFLKFASSPYVNVYVQSYDPSRLFTKTYSPSRQPPP